MEPDIRWKQRFSNYKKSFSYLNQALNIENPDMIQKAGIIQFFEMSFELAWKVLKDYLQGQGFIDVNSPRSAIKKAFELELINNGTLWLNALEDRNLTAHTYNEETSNQIISLIKKDYINILKNLDENFTKKL